MIFGHRTLIFLTVLVWGALISSVPAVAGDWTLERLGRALSEETEGRVSFREERTVSYLAAPIVLTGYVARRGERIEKHVVDPRSESTVFTGDRIEIESKDGWTSIDVDDHPMLRGLSVAIRAALGGHLERLADSFEIRLTGMSTDWSVDLIPRDNDVQEHLSRIELTGSRGRVSSIRILAANGDRSVMTLRHGAE